MRSLFVKLLLSFILITLLASFTTALFFFLTRANPYKELQKQVLDEQYLSLAQNLSITAMAVNTILENGCEKELINYLHGISTQEHSSIFLLKENNETFSGRKLPRADREVATASRKSHDMQYQIADTTITAALPFLTKAGQTLIITGSTSGMMWPPLLSRNKNIGLQKQRQLFSLHPLRLLILLMLLIASAGCYLLARSLTTPIRNLRKATRQISRGDLSARVDPLGRSGDEIADLSRDFNTMAERIHSLLNAQKRLLRDVSHELRSPLTRQKMALELARQQFSKAEPWLSRIEKESDRLNELIGQLLLLTRLEADVDNSLKELVNLQKLVSEIVHDAEFEAINRNRKIKIQNLDDVTVIGSKEMLCRAVENIIRNGLQYTTAGSAVEISLLKDNDEAVFAVRDHGPGVPKEYLEQIFKPFFRVAESRDRNSGGTGIGLAIVKSAVLMHGGNINARNGENGGLIIEMHIPCFHGADG